MGEASPSRLEQLGFDRIHAGITGVGTGVGTSVRTGVGTSVGTGVGTGVGTCVGTYRRSGSGTRWKST